MTRFGAVGMLLLIAVLPATAASARKARTISWSELRPMLVRAFCAIDLEHEGQVRRIGGFGSVGCPKAPRKTPLERAILEAFDDAHSVLVSVTPQSSLDAQKIPALEERRAKYAAALLADEMFSRALVVSLKPALARAGFACSDCTAAPPPPPLSTRWVEFQDYVAAHVWPDPVNTPRGSDGKPSGKPSYSFHVCAGLNGISRLPKPNPRLVQAAFVAGFDTDLAELAYPLFDKLLKEPALQGPASDDEKTEYLRRRMGEEVKKSARIRRATCRAIDKRRAVLGISVDPC
jgi:hypothetical protein